MEQAHRNSRHVVGDGRRGNQAFGNQTIDRILCRHKCAGDGSSACAAIGLQHIAIKLNGALTQFFQIKHRPHRASNEALNFLGATTLLALGSFAVATGVGGTRQHAVLGRDPAFATAAFVRRHFFFYRSGAQDLGVTKRNQN